MGCIATPLVFPVFVLLCVRKANGDGPKTTIARGLGKFDQSIGSAVIAFGKLLVSGERRLVSVRQ